MFGDGMRSVSSTPASTTRTPTSAASGPRRLRRGRPDRRHRRLPDGQGRRWLGLRWRGLRRGLRRSRDHTPVPDDNPLDCDGHGSHVAGTAAGFGVNADGSTFTGDYSALDAAALDDHADRAGHGAQGADLRAQGLRLPGWRRRLHVPRGRCPRLDARPQRRRRLRDHLDVVNISIGADYSSPDDPENDWSPHGSSTTASCRLLGRQRRRLLRHRRRGPRGDQRGQQARRLRAARRDRGHGAAPWPASRPGSTAWRSTTPRSTSPTTS